ncbi:urokinase plasminogen activator surface receptor [Danio rerio]|uniref:Urokinase plasminogen activator surface receptor n=1 Tax=Danio rerio TaxID=7955 RepID=A0A8M9PKD7_DANRE|nr:urokinase plasminogen activator surface receptor-like [Danio rerio]|eukprot:XP_021322721.1 urokinase plasminogen activator surface receptor-like [Danio rerio]
MDLQVSVFLLFVAFTSGHSLNCYQCGKVMGVCIFPSEKTCPSGMSMCESVTLVSNLGLKMKGKDCSADCASGTINFGDTQMSSTCCNSDKCNKEDPPDHSTGTPNGKMCYYCKENSCLYSLSCSGTEDHCVTATANFSSQPEILKGCASKSFCDAKGTGPFKSFSCCSGNLCNGAKSNTQSFVILCLPLIAFLLML